MFSSRPLPPSPTPAPPPRDAPDAGPPGRLRLRGVWKVLPPAQPPPGPHAGSHRYLPGGPRGGQSLFPAVGDVFRFLPGEVRGQAFSPGITL